ncbi:MAG TPA: hypothetical protein DIU14_08695 [Actinobacteria bacterium]|nr:hypothetical protein [Actinomycetota bacterium]
MQEEWLARPERASRLWATERGERMEPVQAVEEHLSRITHLLVANRSSDAVLKAVADALTDVAPHDALTIHEIDSPLQILRPLMVRETRSGLLASLDAAPYGAGLGGLAVRSARPRLITGPSLPSDEGDGQPGSLVIVPLTTRDELRGVLSLARCSDQVPFSEEEFQAAVRLGELAALAIDSAQVRARLEIEGVTDTLTGLYNHRHFHERLAEEVRRAHRQRTSVGVLVLDIDDFRRINDTHGHLLGDQVLQGIATIARITCRLEDVLCRIGGEEFAVILPNCDVDSSASLAERLRQAVNATAFPSVGEVSISIGVAEGPRHASSSRELTACGQLALDSAKRSEKNRVCVYDESDGGLGPHWTISTNGSGFDGVFIPSSEDAGWPVAPERAERWRATYSWTSPGPSADGGSNDNGHSNGDGNSHPSDFRPQVGPANDDRSTEHVAPSYRPNGTGTGNGHPNGNGSDHADPAANGHRYQTPGSSTDGAQRHLDEAGGSRSSTARRSCRSRSKGSSASTRPRRSTRSS